MYIRALFLPIDMLFSSPIFLFLFLPVVLFTYYIIPNKFRNVFLLFMSLVFYTWGEKELVILIVLSTVIDFSAGLIIESGRKKMGLNLSLLFNLGILIYFKYSGFMFTNLADLLIQLNISVQNAYRFSSVVLPLGISFYTFQTMSYTIDVYRGDVKASRNFINFATYVTLFPQLIAGPIVRYKEIETALKTRRTTKEQFSRGIERFIIGLAKKMIIANNCAFLADGVFSLSGDDLTMPLAWLGAIAYSVQIYFDFSGYSDMAIGLGLMFGFEFPENFNFPYISKSIREFWTRWHITLSQWFRDYVYISLGGNRNNNTYRNLFIVFFLTGLWHGANWSFLVWGIYHGLFLVLERLKLNKILNNAPNFIVHIYVILVLLISWVIFRSANIEDAFFYIMKMFSFDFSYNSEFITFYLSTEVMIALTAAIIFSTPILSLLANKMNRIARQNGQFQFMICIKASCLLLLFAVSLMYVAVDSYNPFIYFRF